jgi:hypothetical protein
MYIYRYIFFIYLHISGYFYLSLWLLAADGPYHRPRRHSPSTRRAICDPRPRQQLAAVLIIDLTSRGHSRSLSFIAARSLSSVARGGPRRKCLSILDDTRRHLVARCRLISPRRFPSPSTSRRPTVALDNDYSSASSTTMAPTTRWMS